MNLSESRLTESQVRNRYHEAMEPSPVDGDDRSFRLISIYASEEFRDNARVKRGIPRQSTYCVVLGPKCTWRRKSGELKEKYSNRERGALREEMARHFSLLSHRNYTGSEREEELKQGDQEVLPFTIVVRHLCKMQAAQMVTSLRGQC